ncbi:NAD(P)H-binding protein [Kibdelosporangium persicum]|uniref:NmrA family transcriptional regulator n=1 Tax=Kibdelosporangium persicum TaxID=2698649 RepID=A0ABX2F7T7_9PSEU|nr:NAD(P)H-binding protein [Kibdelosporangium persicum]NRN67263.1 NmrA family transcriptional regulator [Kibdelosporangium persicum]
MIVVTTPTGAIGSQVVTILLDNDAPVRVIVRDPARLSPQVRERVEVVPGSHGDIDVVTKAFAGADAVLWVVPPNFRTDSLDATYVGFTKPACAAMTSQGVERVVGVSALGRGTPMAGEAGLVTASLAMDDLIAGTGVGYRSLALPSFMDNVLRQAAVIRNEGVYAEPMPGDHRAPTCATRDIAAVAAKWLLDSSWSGQDSVAVLGPEDLSYNDMARIMSEVLQRPVRYEQIPIDRFKEGLLANGASAVMAQGYVDMVVAKQNGLDNAEPRTPESSSPTTFRQWCEDVFKV